MAPKFNPFQPNKMVAPGMFAGRLEELRTIEQCLFQAKNGNPQHFLVEGERGIGKSSLLFLIGAYADGTVDSRFTGHLNFLTVSVDMAGVATQLDIVRAIGRSLKSEVSDRNALIEGAKKAIGFLLKIEVMGVKYRGDVSPTNVADDARDELVAAIVNLLSDSGNNLDGVFIIIDEADSPPESADLGEFIKLLTERVARKGCNNLLLGLSGLPSTIAKLRASHESSPRILEIMHLDPLEMHEAKQVVELGLASATAKNGFETTVTPEAMGYLCELSEGYPHFIQQFAYCAFAADKDNHIDMLDVLEGANKENGALAQLGSKYFNEMYYGRVSSLEYRKVLNTMADHRDEWVARKTLVKDSGVKETTLNNALNALKAKKVILADETRPGHYRLPTKAFAAWINAIKSVAERSNEDVGSLFDEVVTNGHPASH